MVQAYQRKRGAQRGLAVRAWGSSALVLAMLASLPAPALAQAARGDAAPEAMRVAEEPTLALVGYAGGVRSAGGASQALAIEVLDIKVRIIGSIAETSITATFRNDSSAVMEGDFHFDMPRGSVLTGYALDVGQVMIDGVLAGRDQAREAYQRRVVQRIDPGLAEVGWSDRFSTRIFPIPARGSRTIRLVMTSPLDPVSGYALPMRPSGAVGRLTMQIESADGTPPHAALPTGVSGEWRDGRVLVDQWNVRMGGAFSLPPLTRRSAISTSRHANGQIFFDIEDSVPATPAPGNAGVKAPVHIFWDRSVSRSDDRLADERALIREWIGRDGRAIAGLTLFDSGGAETLRPADAAELDRRLAAAHYGGGTSFATIADVAVAPGAICLLVSDGRSTIDSRTSFAPGCRVFAIASDREVDRGWLADVAQRSGGAFIELGSVTREQALAMLSTGGSEIGRLVDGAGRPVQAVRLPAGEGRFRLIGPMSEAGELRLMQGQRMVRSYAAQGPATSFSGPGALWASRRIAAASDELSTAQLVDLSRRYSVASPLASFIVLENPGDYVEANIPPPESYPKALREQFAAMRASADSQIANAQRQRLGEVEGLWREQVTWWQARFDPEGKDRLQEETPRPVPQARVRGDRQPELDRVEEAVPVALPPPPPPAPPPPASASAEDEDGSIMVTAQRRAAPNLESASPISVVSGETLSADAAADSVEQAAEGAPADAVNAGAATPADRQEERDAASIRTVEWSSSRPWVAAFDAAGDRWADAVAAQSAETRLLPLFWFDLAEWHFRAGRRAEARRAVESALDLPTRDNQTLEIVASRLQRYGDLDRAIALMEQLVDRENERPQPQWKLGVLLMQRAELARAAGRTAAAKADLERAITAISDAVLTIRREQPRGFITTMLMDANLAVARYRALAGAAHALPPSLVRMLDTDIRIVVNWNTPRTDLDLWSALPSGERVGFSNLQSPTGARLTADVTTGYGPEEFLLRSARAGTYAFEVQTYAGDRTNPNGPSTLSARIIRNFGRANQTEELIDLEMDPDNRAMLPVARVEVGGPPRR